MYTSEGLRERRKSDVRKEESRGRKVVPRGDCSIGHFLINSENVSILTSANEFRTCLFHGIESAERRVNLVSLYIGAEQDELMRLLVERVRDTPSLRVSLLTDFARSLRPDRLSACGTMKLSSAQVLTNTYKEVFPLQPTSSATETWKGRRGLLEAFMYRTPLPWYWWWSRFVPYKLQEVLGVLHWKFYIFDNDVLVTGANISSTYLTDRHDRWIYIQNEPDLVNTLDALSRALQEVSHCVDFTASANNNVVLFKPTKSLPEVAKDIEKILKSATTFTPDQPHDLRTKGKHMETCTCMYVCICMYALLISARIELGIHCGYAPSWSQLRLTEARFLAKALYGYGKGLTVFSSPYLNLSKETQTLLREQKTQGDLIIVGSDIRANSFYNAGHVLSAIPFTYIRLTAKALTTLAMTLERKIHFYAFYPDPTKLKSTFHAKGIWTFLSPKDAAQLTSYITTRENSKDAQTDVDTGRHTDKESNKNITTDKYITADKYMRSGEDNLGGDGLIDDQGRMLIDTNDVGQVMTLAGSSNFCRRSQERDLECLLLIETADTRLVKGFAAEAKNILESARRFSCYKTMLRDTLVVASWPIRVFAKYAIKNNFFTSLL